MAHLLPRLAFWLATDQPDECAEFPAPPASPPPTACYAYARGPNLPVIDLTQEPITGLWLF